MEDSRMKAMQVMITEIDFSDVAVMRMEEAIRHLAAIKLVRQEYTTQQVEEPKHLAEQQRRLERRVQALREDALAHELARLEGEAAQDQTPESRRVDREKKIADLRAQLSRT
jgi:hypothetical protein